MYNRTTWSSETGNGRTIQKKREEFPANGQAPSKRKRKRGEEQNQQRCTQVTPDANASDKHFVKMREELLMRDGGMDASTTAYAQVMTQTLRERIRQPTMTDFCCDAMHQQSAGREMKIAGGANSTPAKQWHNQVTHSG